jgi:hypothetical protein
MLFGLEIKLLDAVSLDDGHAGFLPVARVDQHAHGHQKFSGRPFLPSGGGRD